MRVLVVSHNVFSRTTSMGKTLQSYFRDFGPGEIAQLYIQPEVPTDDSVCRNYYRFTDQDALKSILNPGVRGTMFGKTDIRTDLDYNRTDEGLAAAAYRYGKRRTGAVYFLRNLVWKWGRCCSRQLMDWVDAFDPDVVFFASGDYGFMYDMAVKIADHARKPLVVCCVDDYYEHNANENTLLGRRVYRSYMETVEKTIARAECIFTICDSMARAYEKRFGKRCHTLHTPASMVPMVPDAGAKQISYIGNLDYRRYAGLQELGRAVKELACGPGFIDVYSPEQRPEILKQMTEESGIRFHGRIPAEEVREVMAGSMAVIHTESFDEDMMHRTRFSVSTKIADSLMYGPCLIAYGPEGIASVDYLKENGAAYVISDRERLTERLSEFLTDGALRARILKNARDLAARNHDPDINAAGVRGWLTRAADENVNQTDK